MERAPIVLVDGIKTTLPPGDTLPQSAIPPIADIDGGSASSVFTASQIIDGGTVNG